MLAEDMKELNPPARAFRAERVIKAAIELATKGGYDGVQMRAVATRARVALGTLYRYYPSKDDLIRAAIEFQINELRTDIITRPLFQKTAGERVAQAYIRAFHAMVRNPGFAHAALSSYHVPMPYTGSPEEPNRMMPGFTIVAAIAAWGPNYKPKARESLALEMIRSFWITNVVDWLNHDRSQAEVEKNIRLAARLLPLEQRTNAR